MAAKRLAALVGALLLVLGAVALRNFLDNDGRVSLGRSAVPVVCDPIVFEACKAAFPDASVEQERPGETLDRLLSSPAPEPTVWVTADVWLEILASESARTRVTDPVGDATKLAGTDLALAAVEGRAQCVELSWSCLAEGGAEGGGLELGYEHADSTVGILTRSDLIAAHFGRTDFDNQDLESPEFGSWWTKMQRSLRVPSQGTAFVTLVVKKGELDVAPVPAALTAANSRGGVDVVLPVDHGRAITIVAASVAGARLDVGDLAERLTDTGWLAPSAITPDPDAVVDAGVLQALRKR